MHEYIARLLIAASNVISREYFVRLHFNNPFVRTISEFIKAASPEEAADKAKERYWSTTHLAVFTNADACFKGKRALVRWALWEREGVDYELY